MELELSGFGASSWGWNEDSNATCFFPCNSSFEIGAPKEPRALSIFSYMYALSTSTIEVPGTGIAVYMGSTWAITEQTLVFCSGLALLAASAYLGYCVSTSLRLTPRTKQALLWSEMVGLALMPFGVLSWFGPLSSRVANFTIALVAVLGCFRLFELLCKTGPKGCDSSCGRFVLYVMSPAEIVFDGEGRIQEAPRGLWKSCLKGLLAHVLVLVLVLCLGRPSGFKPFLEGAQPLTMKLLGFPWALPAIHLQATFIYAMLTTTFNLFRLLLAVAGVETHNPMRQPLLLSTSIRDFWGRRWNLLIHRLMHRSFFAPLAAGPWNLGPRVGAAAAFAVSGLFHEYMWLVTNWHEALYTPGAPMKFFAVQAVLLTGESHLKRTSIGKALALFPSPVLTLLTTSAILPFGPLFLHDLSGMIDDSLRIYPHFLILN